MAYSETGAVPCIEVFSYSMQPPWCGAIPSEGIKGDE